MKSLIFLALALLSGNRMVEFKRFEKFEITIPRNMPPIKLSDICIHNAMVIEAYRIKNEQFLITVMPLYQNIKREDIELSIIGSEFVYKVGKQSAYGKEEWVPPKKLIDDNNCDDWRQWNGGMKFKEAEMF